MTTVHCTVHAHLINKVYYQLNRDEETRLKDTECSFVLIMKYILSGIPLIHKINQFSDNPKILHIEYISILLYLRLYVVKCGLTIDSVPPYYICIYSDVQIKSAKASCTLYSSSTAQKLGNTRCTVGIQDQLHVSLQSLD